VELDARGRRLRAALATVLIHAHAPELALIHRWLDTWSGIGRIIVGMTHPGFQVSLGRTGCPGPDSKDISQAPSCFQLIGEVFLPTDHSITVYPILVCRVRPPVGHVWVFPHTR
jgi:hypothetical protein